ncbi:TonB-dependent vitamin B12 receptor [Lysobacter niabensis]|uniref:TonB-dependent vitamin B12 receptor n=1 Tax=Agrilutibacter niabensis TaxID=380628 RepID=UPI003624465D
MQSRGSNAPRRTLLAASLLCAVAPAFTAEGPSTNATALDDVIVTASRTPQAPDAALAAVTVITREDIELRAPASLPELLRGMPGVTIASNGGPGKVASTFLRGTDSDHTLVLVDGVRIGSATSGGAAYQDIPVEQIERIEIVRGPFSSLYGADAIGGVIHIFTRRPHDSFDPSFNVGAGNYGTQRYGAGIGGRGETSDGQGGWYQVHAAYESTDGFDSYRDNPDNPFDDFTLDTDRDGYRNQSLSLGAGHRFNKAWDVEARALRAEGNNKYDGFNDESDIVQQVVGGRVRYAPTEKVTLSLNLGRADDLSDNFTLGAPNGHFDSHRTSGSLQGDFGVGQGLLTFGYDWRRDEVDSDTQYDVDSRITRGVFGQWQHTFGAHSLQLGLRRDDDTQFGGKTTGSARWGWDFTEALRLTASYGTAYRAPTFNDLYYPFFGNPGLSPESSRSFELGLRGKHGWGGWTINAFENRVDDLIGYDPTPTPERPFGQPDNVDEARIRGTEATIDTTVWGWSLQGNVTWLDPRNTSGGFDDGNLLPRRSRTNARVDLDRSFGAFSVGASVAATGKRYDDPSNTLQLGGYATTDLRFGYTFAQAWTLQVNANNVFDKTYETAMFYPQPGRNWFVSLRYITK